MEGAAYSTPHMIPEENSSLQNVTMEKLENGHLQQNMLAKEYLLFEQLTGRLKEFEHTPIPTISAVYNLDKAMAKLSR
ncbi:unnamed protein product [Angiostrongylus costaricensis]|uniref:Uncharacterized protein n=1 Tax=Angiostrongylus costaricensis TaxID=334426 RepID=A0A0R3PIP3_ANGCS|nr:unnamed protein product [Angiostrongylus costaricensis]